MRMLDQYFGLQKRIYDYFGYVEDWAITSLDDAGAYYWYEDGDSVYFADTEEELESQDGNYYVNEIYTQRFLKKWVYRADGFTMICVDTHSDGNKLLQIFDNKKERKPVTQRRANPTAKGMV